MTIDRPRLRAIWERASLWIVGIAVAIGILLGAYGIVAIHETHQIVVSHDTELAQTKAIANQVLKLQKQSSTNHTGTVTYLEALCVSTPGCPAAVQQMEGG